MSGKKRILIVEDDVDFAESISMILEGKGFETSSASSLEEGLAKAREEKPDLILLDIMMPTGTEGFHFVWKLRKDDDPEVRDIPIIVLTAIHGTTELRFYPTEGDTEYGPGEYLPVQDFIDKPVSPSDLIAKVEKVLGGK
jgi:CheY-like chemotaxis protein